MEKEFAPYELALKMKQLGFDEPCLGGYNPNPVNDDDLGTLIYPTIKLDFEDEDIIFNDTESNQPNCWTIEDDVILAPTFSQAFRWFREKYKLHAEIRSYTAKYFTIIIQELKDIVRYIEYGGIDLKFNTYEEAEIACLEKLIEIVEKL
jgi:hypothetical protein